MSLNNLGRLLADHGDYAGAEGLLAEACQVHDAARSRIPLGQSRSTFQVSPYPYLAATNLFLHHDDQAWSACEQALGRSLWELLQSAEQRGLSPHEQASEDSLRLVLGDLDRLLEIFRKEARKDSTAETQQHVEDARNRLLATEAQWSVFQQEIAAKYPVTEGQAFELARVQAALQSNEAIVGWLDLKQEAGQSRLPSWGYVLRHQDPVAWRKLSEGSPAEGDLHSTQAFRFEISQPPTVANLPPREARAIYDERLAPLMDDLKEVRHLIVIPSGDLLGIPVEALVTNGAGELLEDRFAVSYTPSATIHTWLRERAAKQEMAASTSCLAMGDPPFSPKQLAAMNAPAAPGPTGAPHPDSAQGLTFLVPPEQQALGDQEDLLVRSTLAGNREALASLLRLPSTREEVQAVARLHGAGSRLLLGPEVSEPELVWMAQAGELKQFRTIHIATHALMDDERPENSALILSQVDLPDPLEAAMSGTRIYDGCLTAGEIVGEWELEADLVTVSACETGLGRKVAGEGYIGLAHAFLQAGARALLVSLWKVEDRSTSLLMERFYGNRLERGQTKVEALREAKRWLREWEDTDGSRPYAHPFYWAGFVLIGEAM
jgi:CHAT domain-containing protein